VWFLVRFPDLASPFAAIPCLRSRGALASAGRRRPAARITPMAHCHGSLLRYISGCGLAQLPPASAAYFIAYFIAYFVAYFIAYFIDVLFG
jgi:hypothetical protein